MQIRTCASVSLGLHSSRAKAGGESYLASSMTLYNEVLARRPDLLPALFEPFPTDRRGEVPEGMQPLSAVIHGWVSGEVAARHCAASTWSRSPMRSMPRSARG